MDMTFFATTAKGIEAVLAREIEALGLTVASEQTGGVAFTGTMEAAYRANLWLRTANRILMPLIEFDCFSEQDLYDRVRRLDWPRYLKPSMTLAVDANVRDSNITHSKYAALKTKDAIVDNLRAKLGSRPDVNPNDPDLRVNVHIHRNRCTLSLDTSGESLHRRGYRRSQVEAPLKETLAAALVELTGWDGTTPFIDPMCGSGTIIIEAALKAANIAPGLIRERFGFERWLNFDKALWDRLIGEARAQRKHKLGTVIAGYDASSKAIKAAAANVRAAGLEELITLGVKDISDFTPPPGPGVIIVNPPYGERLGDKEELAPLYKLIGDVFKQRCNGYTGYVFTGNLDLAKRIGLKTSRRFVLYNGPIESRLLKFELY
ncbi:MAG: THUMP domain-containing protein [Actinomycetota bacterium]|nr:THUMP domain-containing protein [Actinomycetota bacterium]